MEKNNNATVFEVAQRIKQSDNILLLSHQSPDGDTLGSAYGLYYALRKIGKKVRILCNDPIPNKYSYMTQSYQEMEFEPELIVTVDIADVQLFGDKVEQEYKGKIDIAIDHHYTNSFYAKTTLVDEKAGATCEVIYEVIKAMEIELDKEIATPLYTGITTDTGCFKYSNATSRTYRIAADLIDCGVEASTINRIMFEIKSKQKLKLEKHILNTMEYAYDGRCAMIFITKQALNDSGVLDDEIDGLSTIPRQVDGVELGITFREKSEGVYKISMRSNEYINASEICQEFGGGGHKKAAGCSVEGTILEVKERILKAVEKYV